MARVVLLHGTGTTSAVWDLVIPLLGPRDGHDVVALDPPRTGGLDREVAWLRPRVAGCWVVGMGDGATLGLALAAAGAPLAGAVLHEPEMLQGFEPQPPALACGPVTVTYGAWSPGVRRQAAEALRARWGYRVRELPGSGHVAALDAPEAFAHLVGATMRGGARGAPV
ncbi:alpha/beta fold hydrolase [Nocardioides mangrovi]|uniref:Alpha/beta hydrolase n=1 Tax=Nocardioides mangrovi TaxID=2874580 RepID=A0ABS7U824_9ACTN|nr:hypothetical protein [Nocardioides mangrovi]MBZ5737086.1 hypothetical protein [Nocardioides mangrovi]